MSQGKAVKRSLGKGVMEFYTDILAQAFSPCGNYLAAASIYGDIHVFELSAILNPTEKSALKPILTFSAAENGRCCSLLSTEKFLIVGTVGNILGFEWRQIKGGKAPKTSWCWELPSQKDRFEVVECNALAISNSGNVYAGCGDSKIHVFSLEDGRILSPLTGHQDYVHDVQNIDTHVIASASEDGSVRIWDIRTKVQSSILEPWKNSRLERPQLGKWVGSLHYSNESLLCGGGVKTSLWHLGAMHCLENFASENVGVHACSMVDDLVLVGERNKVSLFNLQGDPTASISSSSETVLSIVSQEKPHKVLSIAGNSQHLDICTNLDYRELVISCW